MNYDYEQTALSKAILSGLFAGIFATCVNLIYNFIYRGVTDFNPSAIINVASIIIISTLVVTAAGVIFYFFVHYIQGGKVVFKIIFLILTIISVYYSMQVQRSSDPAVSKQFEGLLSGIIAISGGFIIFYIPYLFNHEKLYS